MAAILERPEEKAISGFITLRLDRPLDDDMLLALSAANGDLQLERNAQGELIVMAPSRTEIGGQDAEVVAQLVVWAKQNGKGKAFGPSAGFRLPNTAVRAPDACWVSHEKLASITKEQYRKFAPLCPEFVIELMSPSDSLKDAQDKMLEYIANGAELGWLIDPDNKRVYVYNSEGVDVLEHPEKLEATGKLQGFVLDLLEVW
jgi:Uma2 family endonuclease